MKKKLALCAALIHGPRLLFLDEPFEGIDAVASRQIKELLNTFVARGGTVFLTSHILEIVERLSTHIGVIADGRIVAQGRIEHVRAGAHGRSTSAGANASGAAPRSSRPDRRSSWSPGSSSS